MSDSLLPYSYRDKHNLALENCIKTVFDIDAKKIMLTPVENADTKLLPYLAKEFHITGYEGWNTANSEKHKQNLIKNSLSDHAKKGTKNTITEALRTLDIDSEFAEFWEYGGRPGHYSVKFIGLRDRGITEELEETIRKMIALYVPKSRIMDNINFFLTSNSYIYSFSRVKTNMKTILKTESKVI